MVKTFFAAALPIFGLAVACSSSSNNNNNDAGASCATAGGPVSGAPDTHCSSDAGPIVQTVSAASCSPDAGAPDDAAADDGSASDGGANGIGAFGATMFNSEGDDDDCKYHLKWSATPICTGADVFFTLAVTLKSTQQPAAGAPIAPEVFLNETHPAPSSRPRSTETSPGTYTIGPVRFDASGKWTVRFHISEQCVDTLPDSPHGHGAFYVDVP